MMNRTLRATSEMKRTGQRRGGSADALGWLNRTQQGSSLVATAQRLMTLQQHVSASLPGALGQVCQVLKWQEGELHLAVPAAAHSAKLRQVLPRLTQNLQKQGWEVNQIRVRVQASRPFEPERPARVANSLPDQGIAAFAELQHLVPPESPLHEAITRLLQRRGL